MKKWMIMVAAVALSTPAIAQSSSDSQSYSGAQAGVSITQEGFKPVPNAIAPGLFASGLSCSGSASVGAAGAGWGAAFGLTRKDQHCDAREDAKYLQAITGNTVAAKARLCMVKEIREAFKVVGDPCPQDASPVQQVTYQPRVVKSFNSMEECQEYAAQNPNVRCRSR